MKKRLFIAINLAPELQTQLGYLIDQLQDFPELKTVAKNQLHLTLAFLGDVDEGRIPQLSDILDALPKTHISLEILSPALFPSGRPEYSSFCHSEQAKRVEESSPSGRIFSHSQLRRPSRSLGDRGPSVALAKKEGWHNPQPLHGIWLPVKENPQLIQLVQHLRAKLKSALFPADPNPFTAHITIARSKTDRAPSQLQQWITDWSSYQFPASPVSAITLYSSQLTTGGPIHILEYSVELRA